MLLKELAGQEPMRGAVVVVVCGGSGTKCGKLIPFGLEELNEEAF